MAAEVEAAAVPVEPEVGSGTLGRRGMRSGLASAPRRARAAAPARVARMRKERADIVCAERERVRLGPRGGGRRECERKEE